MVTSRLEQLTAEFFQHGPLGSVARHPEVSFRDLCFICNRPPHRPPAPLNPPNLLSTPSTSRLTWWSSYPGLCDSHNVPQPTVDVLTRWGIVGRWQGILGKIYTFRKVNRLGWIQVRIRVQRVRIAVRAKPYSLFFENIIFAWY